ncbi:hypothetical protein BAMA_00390 [Bacillus manliponensis]|uniref:ABM domain-containing protein n=2 Tax=Bacillus manliponensis TaxID=574376 RepID=A0A073K1P8_9BACI|nr:hypothetical protein BAMA_00390 [Bacillus manliponensis]
MEEQLREMGRNMLVPINKDAGCIHAYFLEPSVENDNASFGVVSIWPDKETLDTMKHSKRYRTLIQNMSPLIESLTDCLYLTD